MSCRRKIRGCINLDLNIYDTNLNFLGIIENYASLLWVRKYFEAGNFELVAPATEININLLKRCRLIEKPNSVEVGYISSIAIKMDVENGEFITVSGFFLTGLLARHIIYDAAQDDDLITVIDKQMGSLCKNPARIIDNLVIDYSTPINSKFNAGQKYYNLAEYATAICKSELCGLLIKLSHDNVKPYLLLTVHYGVNRSIEQVDNPQAVFSSEFDNLLSSEYQYSEDAAANVVYGYATVEDDVEGVTPEYLLGDGNCGFERMETAVAVSAVTYSYTVDVFQGYNGEGAAIYKEETHKRINQKETIDLLEAECNNNIREINENMTGKVDFAGGYKKDYELGDVVTVHNPKWDILINQRIYEITEFYENGIVSVTPIFGSPLRTIVDFLDTT